MNLSLRRVDAENWRQICALEVAEDQRAFVAPNWYSLVQAAYGFPGELSFLTLVPLAIHVDESPVGFVMYNTGPDREHFFIMRLMIDAREQRKGYARVALEQLLERFKENPRAKEVAVGYVPGNEVARKLYLILGFEEIGLDDEGSEMIAVRNLNAQDEPWESIWRRD